MPIKHALVSGIADDAVPAGKVQPSNWNANHDLSAMVINDVPGLTTALAGKAAKGTFAKDTSGSYRALWPSSTPTALAHTLSAWRAQLVLIPLEMTVIPVVNVITAVATSKINAALYAADPSTGLPVTRVADFGAFDTSTTGLKVGSSVTIPPGEYWFVYVPSGATTGTITSSASTTPAGLTFSRVTLTSGVSGSIRGRLESVSAAQSPLPATLTAVTWTEATGIVSNPVHFQVQ